MPVSIVQDGSLGSSIAQAFMGGDRSAAMNSALSSTMSARNQAIYQQQQIEQQKAQLAQQRELEQARAAQQQQQFEQEIAIRKSAEQRELDKAAAASRAATESAGLAGTLADQAVVSLDAFKPPVTDVYNESLTSVYDATPHVGTKQAAAVEQAKQEAKTMIPLLQRQANNASDFQQSYQRWIADRALQLTDLNDKDAARRSLIRINPQVATDPKTVFTEQQRVKMLEEERATEAAKIRETAGAKLATEPLVIDPQKNTYLPPAVTQAVPNAPQTTTAAPDTKGVDELRKEVIGLPSFKEYSPVRTQTDIIEQTINDPGEWNGLKEAAVITAYSKLLDPTTGVREGEAGRIAQAQGMFATLGQTLEYLQGGGQFTEDLRKKMQQETALIRKTYEDVLNRDIETRRPMATRRGYRAEDWEPGTGRAAVRQNPPSEGVVGTVVTDSAGVRWVQTKAGDPANKGNWEPLR
jgi:hypothetical protein